MKSGEPLTPTAEQTEILSHAPSGANLSIRALAGTGKTATLEMFEPILPKRPVLYLAFNKRVVEEAKGRLRSTTTIKTFNSLGLGIWGNGRSIKLDKDKTKNLFKELVDAMSKAEREVAWDCYHLVREGVDKAKALGYVPAGSYDNARRLVDRQTLHQSLEEVPDDLTSDLIDAVLLRSIAAAYKGHIDFNDQLYMPALFGGAFPQFPTVLVDEAQDLNPVQHELLRRLVRGRIIIVGDPWQSIYGFRGAKAEGMAALETKHNMTVLPLSTSFRCPEAVVRAAQWRVPHFRWSKPGGSVETLPTLFVDDLRPDAVILCRNNAPLLHVALLLIAGGRPASVLGSDLGPKLVGIMRRFGPDNQSRDLTLSSIAEWEAIRLERESKTAGDMADCMRVFARVGENLGQAISYAEHIFAQRGGTVLSTVHKAKGLEWESVYFLDPMLIGHSEQEKNIRYVAQTRSADYLAEITTEGIVR